MTPGRSVRGRDAAPAVPRDGFMTVRPGVMFGPSEPGRHINQRVTQ